MTVKVRVFGYLKEYCRDFGLDERSVTLPEPSTAKELLGLLGIPENEDLLLVVNQKVHTERGMVLARNDTVWVYPLMCEG
jgi:sulfur carrier protein ThiS